MKLKNYTSSVPAERSLAKMEKLLVGCGARNITKQYNESQIAIGLVFDLPYNGQILNFKFEVNSDTVFEILWKEVSRKHDDNRQKTLAQAERTAWKIESDALEIQIAKIMIKTAELPQILMGYLYSKSKDKTLFSMMKDEGFKALGNGQ